MGDHMHPLRTTKRVDNLRAYSGSQTAGSDRIPLNDLSHRSSLSNFEDSRQLDSIVGQSLPDTENRLSIHNNRQQVPERNDLPHQEHVQLLTWSQPNLMLDSETTVEELNPRRDIPLVAPRPLNYPHDSLWVTSLAILSIIFPLVTLVVIFSRFHVKVVPTLFADSEISKYTDWTHILVNIRDGTLVYITQIILFISPLLGNFVMGLYSPRIAQTLRRTSIRNGHEQLPRPHHFTTIAALCQASVLEHLKHSYQQIKRRFLSSRGRQPTEVAPVVLQRAARMHRYIFLLGVVTFISGSAFSLTVSMVNFHKVRTVHQTLYEPGRGLSEYCLEGNRTISKVPCSSNLSNPNAAQQRREEFRLVHNASKSSNIEFVTQDGFDSQISAIIAPAADSVPINVDFRATTIGVSTECAFITPICDFRYQSSALNDPAAYLTVFNCSNAFYGVLGKPPIVNPGFSTLAGDPDLCPLCYKPGSSLIIAYFVDLSLDLVYNTLGYDPNTDRPPDDIGVLPDDQLANPFFLAVASRILLAGLGSNTTGNPDVFGGQHTYIELAMRCKITSFDIEYSRVRGIIRDVVSRPTPNGSVLEIYHGVRTYDPTVDSGSDLLEILSQAALQESTENFAIKWEKLFSTQVLGLIGSTLTPRISLQQQTREMVLVAMVPWWAPAMITFCCLTYVVLGVWTMLCKRKMSPGERLLGDQMSTPGEIWKAFRPWDVIVLSENEDASQLHGEVRKDVHVMVVHAEDQSCPLGIR